jgi:CheY-like chemotaxis protein
MELLRLEVARLSETNRHARIGDVIQEILPLVGGMMHQCGLDLQTTIPRILPAVAVERVLLRQMILGMLGYLAECAVQAAVELVVQVQDLVVQISTTIEPPVAVQQSLQAEMSGRLSTLEEMATLSGAGIHLLCTAGVITGFDLRLPIAQLTVLVVDDNEDVLELFRRYLSALHCRAITAHTAQEALEKACRFQPHAITLDLMMPDQDGWDLMQTLLNHSRTSHIPIIVCTVLKQKALALSLGATAFLEKPVSRQALLAVLDSLKVTTQAGTHSRLHV